MFYLRHLVRRALLIRKGHALCTLGEKSTGCSWTFCPNGLGPSSIVYSGGVGNDITFEHALVKRFGCLVHLADPSPTGIATMNLPENKIPQFRFSPVGLAGRCGTLRLAPPLSAQEGSWFKHRAGDGGIEVPCLDLATWLENNGHNHVDLLKLDIEGAEYEVLEHLLKRGIPVSQILVEFHSGLLPGFKKSQTLRALVGLLRHGYKLISEVGTTQTFIKQGLTTKR